MKNKTYQINITDGTATESILNGTYTATTTVSGYDASSITPTSVTITDNVETYNFTVAATGSLSLHVTAEGTPEGTTPIVGATFIRCDKLGNTYGSAITTNESGIATFTNVPFDASGNTNVYYKQTASDGEHNFDDTLQTLALTESTTTKEVQNPAAVTKTINYTDANYANLPIETATITLTN